MRMSDVDAVTRVSSRAATALLTMLLGSIPVHAFAQATADGQDKKEATSTGLPAGIVWTFNVDATVGSFGFANSLYQNPKEGVAEDLSDQWFEGSIKPALGGTHTLKNTSQFYGKLSVVGEGTYGSQPPIFGGDISSFSVDDLSIGWRSGKAWGGENVLDLSVGRAPFNLGHGMLLWDGAAEGGSRGGYWTNARKAFEFAAIARAHRGAHTVEAFYLDKDDLPEGDTGTRLWGANYELSPGEHSTFGASYLKFYADDAVKPDRDGLDVFNVRAYTAPVPKAPDLSFEFEYAWERNGDRLHADAWTLQGAYEVSNIAWKPKFSYRYAFFQGDDPDTPRNESFDSLLTGFYDWGTWWQGEIVGEYVAVNSNLISNLFRVHLAPTDKIGGGIMFYTFTLDQPRALAPNVTSTDLAKELDLYVDWKINENFTASFVAAEANPGAAAEQAFARTRNFSYGMAFLAYHF